MGKKTIITIGRQYGSGGREIGKRLADELGIPFYDKKLIMLAARKGGISSAVMEHSEEKAPDRFFFTHGMTAIYNEDYTGMYTLPMSDKIFILQSEVIQELAQQESCVIVGRCADYVLQDNPCCIKAFVHSPLPKRIQRVIEVEGEAPNNAEAAIRKIDKIRSKYYNYYSGQNWGNVQNYTITLDSSTIGIDNCVTVLKHFVEIKRGCE